MKHSWVLVFVVCAFVCVQSQEVNTTAVDIVGGEPALEGQYPFIAALIRTSLFCGGSIIDRQFILTAAHCVDGVQPSVLTIRVGSLYHASGGATFKVEAVRSHPDYDYSTIENDVAVLKLATPIPDLPNVGIIPIATSPDSVADNEVVNVAGWGTTQEGGGTIPAALRQVDVNIVNQDKCNQDYAGEIYPSMVCAAAPGKDSCQGDSGGPLISTSEPKTLVGIVSWGYGCARAAYPGVYTRVGSFTTWIKEQISTM